MLVSGVCPYLRLVFSGEPSFVVPELTEEQKKLTEQARQYGQQMEGGKVRRLCVCVCVCVCVVRVQCIHA